MHCQVFAKNRQKMKEKQYALNWFKLKCAIQRYNPCIKTRS